jgi:hypothetical protein
MPPTSYIIVSASNSPYMAWQSKLFHFSCVTRTGAVPLVFVHGGADRPLAGDFHDIAATGGVVVRAPSFAANGRGASYMPRNTPGTLLAACDLCDDPDAAFVLCDPDMIFTRRPSFAPRLSADRYDWMNFGEPRVRSLAERLGLGDEALVAATAGQQGGVPHVVPVALARPIAESWLDVIDALLDDSGERGYVDSMYAFGLACAALELPVACTSHMMTDFDRARPATADMIHYGYGDATWNKRDFTTAEQAAQVWNPPPAHDPSSVWGELSRQLSEAREWYGARVPSRAGATTAV